MMELAAFVGKITAVGKIMAVGKASCKRCYSCGPFVSSTPIGINEQCHFTPTVSMEETCKSYCQLVGLSGPKKELTWRNQEAAK